MEEVIIFMIFIICFLGVWVTRLSSKIKQLEYELVVAQVHFEKDYRDVLLILQKDTQSLTTASTGAMSAVYKQLTENMERVGELEGKFNNLKRYMFETVRTITNEIEKTEGKQGEKK